MAADKLRYAVGNSSSTTYSSGVSDTDTAHPLTSDTAFEAKSGEGEVILDEGTANEEISYATGKSGASLTIPLANRGLEGTSAAAHAAGATVKGILSAGMWNDLVDSLTNVLLKTTGAVDTTKVVTLTGTQVLTNKTLTAPVFQGNLDGWVSANETWTYATAQTFTVAGNVTARFTKGTRLRWTQTTVHYGVVTASSYSAPNTTVTIATTADYVVENAEISANYYSYEVSPQGYPDWFSYVGSVTGAGGNNTNYTEDNAVSKFRVNGKTVTVHNTRRITAIGSWTGNLQMPLPVNAEANKYVGGAGAIYAQGGITIRGIPILANAANMLFSATVGTGYLAATAIQANDWLLVHYDYQMA